jgi:hypothetical protein
LAAVVLTTTSAFAGTIHVPDEYGTIQEAIDAAVNGDEVVVADGTYTADGNRDLDFGGKEITVRSENGADACFIDIQGNEFEPHRAFWFHSGESETSVVQGFTIQNGFMNRGGAVLCENSSPRFEACVFQQNTISQQAAEDGGGAVYILASSPMFADCSFVQNQAEANFLYGGGGAVHNQSDSSPMFTECTFIGNSAVGAQDPDGGAVANWSGAHPQFYSCTFTENQAVWDGAVLCFSASVTMHDCDFQGNDAAGAAGGAFGQYFGGGHSTIVSCSFIGNSAQGNSGGAVVLQHDVSATFTNCHFADNQTTGNGGGLWMGNGTDATVTSCHFADNQAAINGGGLWIGNGTEATVTNCSFSGNAATNSGGGIRVNDVSSAEIVNCAFVQNTAGLAGGALRLGGATVTNCTFAQNTAGGGNEGGAIRFGIDSSATVDNCVLWDNVPQQITVHDSAGPVSVNYSNVQGGWPGTDNSSDDPLFVDPAAGDFRLRSGSPCIDTGDNFALEAGIDTDLDGNPRFVNDPDTPDGGNGGPSIIDRGAYEFCRADTNRNGSVDVEDLVNVILAWGTDDLSADTNADGIVDVADLISVILNWGPCQ